MPVGENIMALSPHLRARLASALDVGIIDASSPVTAVRSTLGVSDGVDGVLDDLAELDRLGISGRAAAAWLNAVEQASARTSEPDLVWSGPEVPGVAARDTARVFDEIVGAAERTLWVSTYAYFDGPQVFAGLAQRLDAVPALRMLLLLNIQRKRGDTTAASELARRFADQFWTRDWPGSSRPSVYYDPRSLDMDGPGAALHAKAVVADSETLFVTSANITGAAQTRNIELGVLIRDRTLAASVAAHFQGLIDTSLLKPLPPF